MLRPYVIPAAVVRPGALRAIPRNRFFPAEQSGEAYADRAAPIGHGQTISQPYMVALMTDITTGEPRAIHRTFIEADGTKIGHFTGGGMDSPWDTAIDGEDNVWVANFGSLHLLTPPFKGRLTKLWGVNAPPGHSVGEPISPALGSTLLSA